MARINSAGATQALIDLWGEGKYPGIQLTYSCGNYFKENQYDACVAWWEKNKHRPRLELLVEGVVNDPSGYGGTALRQALKASVVRPRWWAVRDE